MNRLVIIRIAAWSIVALFFVGILSAGLMGKQTFKGFNFNIGAFTYANAKEYKVGNAEIDGKEIRNIKINWVSGEVITQAYDGETISIKEDEESLEKDMKLRYLVKGDTLTVQYCKSGNSFNWFHFTNEKKKLTVKIPTSLAKELGDFKITSASAKIQVNELGAESLNIENISGDVKLTDIKADDLIVEAVSSDMNISKAEADETKIELVSGDINFEGNSKVIKSENVSGDTSIKLFECPTKVKSENVSGDIELYIPENDGFTASCENVNGDFDSDFATKKSGDNYIYKDGSGDFSFETVNGNTNIYQLVVE